MSTIVWPMAAQGTDAWKAARRGAITGSKAKLTRAFKKNGEPEAVLIAYAMDLARERLGGTVADVYVNAAMRTGTEQEPFARLRYEADTGAFVDEVGFAHTVDGKFGCSVDGLVAPQGGIEVKTLVSSATLFKTLVDGDISEYRDQCLFAMWLLSLDWVDMCLWCPDLDLLRVIRIERQEAEIEALEIALLIFDERVERYRAALAKFLPAPLTGDVAAYCRGDVERTRAMFKRMTFA